MKSIFSKAVIPQKFQKKQLHDLKKYKMLLRNRAEKYAKLSSISVSQCPICSSKQFKIFLSVFGSNYYQCTTCTHVFLKKHCDAITLHSFYIESSDYASTYTDATQLAYRLKHIAEPKVSFVMNYTENKKDQLWLDVGSAIGDTLEAVNRHKNWLATGLEISEQSVKIGKKTWNIDLRKQLLADFDRENPKTKFDVISGFGYFALLEDPLSEMRIAVDKLNPGGLLVLGESNSDSFSTLLQQSFPELTMRHLVPPNTLHGFTEESLKVAVKKLGCEPLVIWKFGLDFFELLKYYSLLEVRFQNSQAFNFLNKFASQFQEVVDHSGKADYMILIAKKQ